MKRRCANRNDDAATMVTVPIAAVLVMALAMALYCVHAPAQDDSRPPETSAKGGTGASESVMVQRTGDEGTDSRSAEADATESGEAASTTAEPVTGKPKAKAGSKERPSSETARGTSAVEAEEEGSPVTGLEGEPIGQEADAKSDELEAGGEPDTQAPETAATGEAGRAPEGEAVEAVVGEKEASEQPPGAEAEAGRTAEKQEAETGEAAPEEEQAPEKQEADTAEATPVSRQEAPGEQQQAQPPKQPVLSRETERERQRAISSSLTRLAAALEDRQATEAERLQAAGQLISSARMRLAALRTEISRSKEEQTEIVERGRKLKRQLQTVPQRARQGKVPAMYAQTLRNDADETVTAMNEKFDEAIKRRAELTEDVREYRTAREAARNLPARMGSGGLTDDLSRATNVLGNVVAALEELNAILDETIAKTVEVSETASDLSLKLTEAMKVSRSRRLLTRTPPPIGGETFEQVKVELATLWNGISEGLQTAKQQVSRTAIIPAILYTLLLAIAVIGAWWGTGVASKYLAEHAAPQAGTATDEVARGIDLLMPAVRAGLLVIAVPMLLGIWGLPDSWSEALQTLLGVWVGYYLLVFILRQLLAPHEPQVRILNLSDETAANAYRTVRGLATYGAIILPVVLVLNRMTDRPEELIRVIQVVYGIGLLVIGALLIRACGGLSELLPDEKMRHRITLRRAGQIAIPLAGAGVATGIIAAGGGYANLSTYVNRCLSLEILVLVAAVFLDQLVLRGPREASSKWRRYLRWGVWAAVVLLQIPVFGLKPYHASYVFGLLAKPIVTVGEKEVTVLRIVKGLLILLLFYGIAGLIRDRIQGWKYLTERFQSGVAYAFSSLSFYIILVAGFLWALLASGFELSVLTVFAGMAGIGIGFGLQDIVKNFISGLILLIERPVAVGDWVKTGNLEGQIQAINLRSTTVRTRDNNVVLVPNSGLASTQVTNLTLSDRRVRMDVTVGVSYSSDLNEVRDLLDECIEDHPDVLDEPKPMVRLEEFGGSSVNFRILAWVGDVDTSISAAPALRQAIWDAFAEHDIEIPFPQSDLHIRSSDIPLPYEGGDSEAGLARENGAAGDDDQQKHDDGGDGE